MGKLAPHGSLILVTESAIPFRWQVVVYTSRQKNPCDHCICLKELYTHPGWGNALESRDLAIKQSKNSVKHLGIGGWYAVHAATFSTQVLLVPSRDVPEDELSIVTPFRMFFDELFQVVDTPESAMLEHNQYLTRLYKK